MLSISACKSPTFRLLAVAVLLVGTSTRLGALAGRGGGAAWFASAAGPLASVFVGGAVAAGVAGGCAHVTCFKMPTGLATDAGASPSGGTGVLQIAMAVASVLHGTCAACSASCARFGRGGSAKATLAWDGRAVVGGLDVGVTCMLVGIGVATAPARVLVGDGVVDAAVFVRETAISAAGASVFVAETASGAVGAAVFMGETAIGAAGAAVFVGETVIGTACAAMFVVGTNHAVMLPLVLPVLPPLWEKLPLVLPLPQNVRGKLPLVPSVLLSLWGKLPLVLLLL